MLQHLRRGGRVCVWRGGARAAALGGCQLRSMPGLHMPAWLAACTAQHSSRRPPPCECLVPLLYCLCRHVLLQVRDSYRTKGWALLDVEKIEQCHHEG